MKKVSLIMMGVALFTLQANAQNQTRGIILPIRMTLMRIWIW